MKNTIKHCEVCKKEYMVIPSKADRPTCSIECGNKLGSVKRRKKELDIVCKQCNMLRHVTSHIKAESIYFRKGFCTRKCQRI